MRGKLSARVGHVNASEFASELGEGNLQVLCSVCNARKGDDEPVLVLTVPFLRSRFKPLMNADER